MPAHRPPACPSRARIPMPAEDQELISEHGNGCYARPQDAELCFPRLRRHSRHDNGRSAVCCDTSWEQGLLTTLFSASSSAGRSSAAHDAGSSSGGPKGAPGSSMAPLAPLSSAAGISRPPASSWEPSAHESTCQTQASVISERLCTPGPVQATVSGGLA